MLGVSRMWKKSLYKKDITSFLNLYKESCKLVVNTRCETKVYNKRISIFDKFKFLFDEENSIYIPEFDLIDNPQFLTLSGKCEMRINDETIKSYHNLFLTKEVIKGYYPCVPNTNLSKKGTLTKYRIKQHFIDFNV